MIDAAPRSTGYLNIDSTISCRVLSISFGANICNTHLFTGFALFWAVAMSSRFAQHRSRSNPPPTHRSQLPTLFQTTHPDRYRKDLPPSPRTVRRGYPDAGEPGPQSTQISYPTHVISDSGSSDSERILPDQAKSHLTLRRRPTGNRKTSIASGDTLDAPSVSRHRRKGSGPEDLALLETHILPPLSKTIDRMTKGKTPIPPLTTGDMNDKITPKSLRLPSRLPAAKPLSQPGTPKPILKSSMRSPTTPTVSAFASNNSSLRSVKGFSPSPKPQGDFDEVLPTFSPTPLLSEKPPTYLSPQGQAPDTSTLYHSAPRTSSRRTTISQQASPRPSYVTVNHVSQHPESPDHTVNHSTEPDDLSILPAITAERAPWDEAFSEAWHLGSRLSTASTSPRPQKPTVSPWKEGFYSSDRTFTIHHESIDDPGSHTPDGDHAILQRKRRETLLALVEGVNSRFDTRASTRESSEYSGQVGVAIGSKESALGEGLASLQRHSGAEHNNQGPGTDRRRSSAFWESGQVYPGEERLSWYESHGGNSSPRISRNTDLMHQELRRHPPSRDPATPPTPKADALMSGRSPVRGSPEPIYPVRAPSPLGSTSQSQRERKRRSASTPPVTRRSLTDPVHSGKKRDPGNPLPRTRSSLFLPTNSRTSRPASGDGPEAFGLPPSLSYVFKDATGRAGIAPAESGKSLDERPGSWKRDSDGQKNPEGFLSSGAERLFQTLAHDNTPRSLNDSSRPQHGFSQAPYETPTQARRASMPTVRSGFSIASMSSAPSVYEDQVEEHERDKNPRFQEPLNSRLSVFDPPQSWRPTVSPPIHHSPSNLYGEAEAQRQEVILEICHTEALFVQRLRTVLRLFIRPLRAQDTSTWISGVPGSIARVFDWFEDIMNLHVEINTELRNVRSDHQAIAERFAGKLRKFVPRFEVYQPYIIRVEEVLRQLRGEDDSSADGNVANFREFVSIQEREEDCEGWLLQNLLLEPVNRLAKWVEMFQVSCFDFRWSFYSVLFSKTLLERTPKQHVDHLPTVSLVSSMKMTLRVMREVKSREEEYNQVKSLALTIEGLTSPSSLARRERRLLVRGSCRLLVSQSQARSQKNSNGNRLSLVPLDATDNSGRTKRSEKRRSLLLGSSPNVNMNTFAGTASPKIISVGYGSSPDLFFSSAEVFVFSDVMLVATPTGEGRWKPVERFGIARILNAVETIATVQGDTEPYLCRRKSFHRLSRARRTRH